VPKVLATAIVMKNRRAFGFADVQPDAALTFDHGVRGVGRAAVAHRAACRGRGERHHWAQSAVPEGAHAARERG
jgi:hypothetical protein